MMVQYCCGSGSTNKLFCKCFLLRQEANEVILLSLWSASKGSQKGGGCHEANDHRCGNGCALSVRLSSCTDQLFGCDRCAVVPA